MLVTPSQPFKWGKVWTFLSSILSVCLLPASYVFADQLHSYKQSLPSLERAQHVFVKLNADSQQETVAMDSLVTIVAQRMSELGYIVVPEPSQAYDVKVEFFCSMRGSPLGPGEKKADQEVAHGSPRVSGPPCLLKYAHRGRVMPWQRIDRIVYTLGVQTVQQLQQAGDGQDPITLVRQYLKQYDFPLLLTAEWGQSERLIRFLKHSDIDIVRKKMILMLLGEMHSTDAIPCLLEFLSHESFIQPAILALGHFGVAGRSQLVRVLQSSNRTDVQAAAAHSLGRIGGTTGDWSLTPLFVKMLQNANLDRAVQIELVWAIGMSPDRMALPILETLRQQVWSIRSHDPQLQELRKAIDVSHRSVRLGGHTDAY